MIYNPTLLNVVGKYLEVLKENYIPIIKTKSINNQQLVPYIPVPSLVPGVPAIGPSSMLITFSFSG